MPAAPKPVRGYRLPAGSRTQNRPPWWNGLFKERPGVDARTAQSVSSVLHLIEQEQSRRSCAERSRTSTAAAKQKGRPVARAAPLQIRDGRLGCYAALGASSSAVLGL
jgi:hypothetical protein